MTIEISLNDKRLYRHVKLANGIDVTLVHDPTTEKSSACCDVRIGSMADPKDAQGLAHFLEHMLFLGTEKYPVENAYSAFLNSHGGHSNAYTDQEDTVYYFDIQSDYFEEALNMFSSFFTCPLFTESATLREINAVDSENTKNLQSDMWRQFQLFKSLSTINHPFNSFSTGNLKTLQLIPESNQKNIRDIVIQFYNQYYSANHMKLVIYGKENLDILQNWAESKFSSVPNKNVPLFHVPSDPYGPSEVGKWVEIVPVKDIKHVDIMFALPAIEHLYTSKPLRYVAHLIGHESEGSILEALKQHGLANGLSASTYKSMLDFSVFRIHIELTDQGFEQVNDVIACVFAYIGMLTREKPTPWIQEEIKNITDLNFKFQENVEPSEYVINIANNMQWYPVTHYLTGDRLIYDLNVESIQSYLTHFTVSNAIIFINHKSFQGQTTQIESYYNTEYSYRDFNMNQSHIWQQAYNGISERWTTTYIHLPQPNPFIPTDFTLRGGGAGGGGISKNKDKDSEGKSGINVTKEIHDKSQSDGDYDEAHVDDDLNYLELTKSPDFLVLHHNSNPHNSNNDDKSAVVNTDKSLTSTRLWYKLDHYWHIPKLNVMLFMESPMSNSSPLNIAFTELLSKVLKEALNPYSYYADCAGLNYDVSLAKSGLDFTFKGYQHKLPVLVDKTMQVFKTLVSNHTSTPNSNGDSTSVSGVPVDIYTRMKEKLLLSFYNHKFQQPYYHCIIGTSTCLEEPRWTPLERYEALKNTTIEEFQLFINSFLVTLKLDVLVHGNYNQQETEELIKTVHTTLNYTPLPVSQIPIRRVIELKAGMEYIYTQHSIDFNPNEKNAAIENFYYVTESTETTTISNKIDTETNEKESTNNTLKVEALVYLIAHMLSEPAFDQLRTKEQLGYIVHTAVKKIGTSLGIHMIIQSPKQGPDYLNTRMETFFIQYHQEVLQVMTAEILATYIEAVKENLIEKPKNLEEETAQYLDEIRTTTYFFTRKHQLASVLSTMTVSDVLAFYTDYILNVSTRKKFSSRFAVTESAAGSSNTEDAATTTTGTDAESTPATAEDVSEEVEVTTTAISTGQLCMIENPKEFKTQQTLLPMRPYFI